MLRRTPLVCSLHHLNQPTSTSWRSQAVDNLPSQVQESPYKDQFRAYWAEPIPWMDREYGPKPKIGDPLPTRPAASAVIVGKNKHVNKDRVAAGEENDYKVLIRFRGSRRRFGRDSYLIPSVALNRSDYLEEWMPILKDGGLTTEYTDLRHRLCAWRALMNDCNTLLIPKNGGTIAEVEGPPGKLRWHSICCQEPKRFKELVGILRMDTEEILSQMLPFRNIITPTSEMFRYNNRSFVIPIDRLPDMQYSTQMVDESLHWVSPLEAIGRYNAGIMNMPAPNVILLSELANAYPTYDDVLKGLNKFSTPVDVMPELVRHTVGKVATVLLPGDRAHSATFAEDKARSYYRRFTYVKDEPHGTRAVFEERPTDGQDDLAELLIPEKTAVVIETSQIDEIYSGVADIQRLGEDSQLQQTTLFEPTKFNMQDGPMDEEGFVKSTRSRESPFVPWAKRQKDRDERLRVERMVKRESMLKRLSLESRTVADDEDLKRIEAELQAIKGIEAGIAERLALEGGSATLNLLELEGATRKPTVPALDVGGAASADKPLP